MIPFILAAVGGYLIGDSMKSQAFSDGGKISLNLSKIKNKFNIPDEEFEKVKIAYEKTGDYSNSSNQEEGVRQINEFREKYPSQYDDVLIYIKSEFNNPNNYEGYVEPEVNWDLFAPKKRKKKMNDGGVMEEDMSIQFIDYKGKTIMFEPNFKEYFSNDIQFDSLKDAKKYIDSGSPDPSWKKFVYAQGLMADGGSVEDRKAAIVKRRTEINDEANKIAPRGKKMKAADKSKMEALQKEYKDLGREWNRLNGDYEEYAKGGSVTDGFVVYFGVFRGRGLTPVITEYHENLEDAEKSIEQKKAKKEKGWKVKALDKMPVNSEVRMGRDNPNYKKVKEVVHSEEKVTEFFKDKDSFYKKDYFWVKPEGYEWDNWQLKKNK